MLMLHIPIIATKQVILLCKSIYISLLLLNSQISEEDIENIKFLCEQVCTRQFVTYNC